MLSIRSEPLPVEAVSSPRLRRILDHWTTIRGDRPVPHRRDVDPIALRGALGIMLIARFEPAHDDFRVTLFGTELAAARGDDATGRLVGQRKPAPHAAFVRDSYRAAIVSGQPSHERVTVGIGVTLVDYTRLVLPLSDSGEWAAAVLVAVEYHLPLWSALKEATVG